MDATVLVVFVVCVAVGYPAGAQTRRTTPARRAPAQPATKTEPAMLNCTQSLGEGVTTKRMFCDIPIGRAAADGMTIALPAHTGPVTLTFDLHNRHTYSEELVRANRAYQKYTATIGVMTADNTLLTRAVVQNEFRTAADLVDRISGGTGPGGLKAVAPTGTETITVVIPAEEKSVSLVGEKLAVVRPEGPDNFTAPGRPIAIISNVTVTYRPAPARAPTRAPARAPARTPAKPPTKPQ